MTIELYAFPTSNGLRALILLEETGEDYVLHKVNLLEGDQRSAEFLAVNPLAQIPAMIDPNGPGGAPVTIEQSLAIMLYLAEKHDKFIPKGAAGRLAFWQALSGAGTDIGMTVASIFAIMRAPDPHEPTQAMFEDKLGGYLSVWNDRFGTQDYAAGGELTLADFALHPVILRLKQMKSALVDGYANLERWYEGINGRPSVAAALAHFA